MLQIKRSNWSTSIEGSGHPSLCCVVTGHWVNIAMQWIRLPALEEESRVGRDSRGCSDCRRRCLLEYIIIHEQSKLGVCLTALLISTIACTRIRRWINLYSQSCSEEMTSSESLLLAADIIGCHISGTLLKLYIFSGVSGDSLRR